MQDYKQKINLQLFADSEDGNKDNKDNKELSGGATDVHVDFASIESLLKELKDKVDRKAAEDRENIRNMVKEAVQRAMNNPQRKAGFELPSVGRINLKDPKEVLYKKADPALRELHEKADNLYLLSQLLGRPAKSLEYWNEYDAELRKTLGTDVVGEGAEWVPEGFSATLIEEVRLALRVAALHGRVDMPRNPFIIPGHNRAVTARLVGEGQTPSTSGSVGTRQIMLNAKKLMAWIPFPYELDEDSAIAILPVVRQDLVNALADAQETATINGDTATTHQDADVTDADDPRKAWDGYRKLSVGDIDLATFNIQALRQIRKAMGKYGVQPSRLAWVTSVSGYMAMMGTSEVLTLDKYGDKATVLTGELGKLDGIPIIVSEFVREDLNASGVYDGVTTDRTEILLVYRPGFVYGDRRQVLVETDRQIKAQTVDVVTSQRLDFQARYDTSTEPIVARGINLTA